jgi:hypothetical protein
VDIFYQVVKDVSSGKGLTSGEWVSLTMSGSESQGYSISLGNAELSRSMSLYGGSTVKYYLVARDNQGNTTQSATFTFQVAICLI